MHSGGRAVTKRLTARPRRKRKKARSYAKAVRGRITRIVELLRARVTGDKVPSGLWWGLVFLISVKLSYRNLRRERVNGCNIFCII